jgi:hypothetical protein
MSSQSASSRVVPASARPASASFGVTIRRLAKSIWRSYERHSLYEVMLKGGYYEGLPDDLERRTRQLGQR